MHGYFSAKEVVSLTGVTYRQLAYWLKIGVVQAALDTEAGSRRRRFCFTDVVTVRAVSTFVKAGMRPSAIKATAGRLRLEMESGSMQAGRTLGSVRLVTDGKSLFRFEPSVEALVKLDGSHQLAFAFDWGTQVQQLTADIQSRGRRDRYAPRERKAA